MFSCSIVYVWVCVSVYRWHCSPPSMLCGPLARCAHPAVLLGCAYNPVCKCGECDFRVLQMFSHCLFNGRRRKNTNTHTAKPHGCRFPFLFPLCFPFTYIWIQSHWQFSVYIVDISFFVREQMTYKVCDNRDSVLSSSLDSFFSRLRCWGNIRLKWANMSSVVCCWWTGIPSWKLNLCFRLQRRWQQHPSKRSNSQCIE